MTVVARRFQRNVGGGVDRDKLPDSAFVFPDERKFPIVIPKDVHDAVRSWGRYRGKKTFAQFKRNLIRKAKSKGSAFVKQLPKEWGVGRKKEDEEDGGYDILVETLTPLVEIEETEDGRLRFKAIALRDNTLSKNNRFYSKEANDRIMEETNGWQSQGNIITMYPTHGAALGSFLSMPTELPAGKVGGPLFREGDNICYRGEISATAKGRDIQTLIQDEVMRATSIRAYDFDAKPMKLRLGDEERDVMAVQRAVVAGVDFCDRPGISGAGIVKVLESAPELFEASYDDDEEETEMDLNEVTLEMLEAEAPAVLDAYLAKRIGPLLQERQTFIDEIKKLKEKPPEQDPALVQAKEQAEADFEAAQTTLAETQAELSLYEACATPGVKKLVEAIQANPPEEGKLQERIDETMADPEFIASIIGESHGQSTATGKAHPGVELDLGDQGYRITREVPAEVAREWEDVIENAMPLPVGAVPEEFMQEDTEE